MRKSFIIAFFAAVIFGAGYFYYTAEAVCPVPLTYSIGSVDSRFGISKDEARIAVSDAESVWEDATGRNLFTYTGEKGKLTINFVYDDRQQYVDAEGNLKEKLDATENLSDAIKDTYTQLLSKYSDLRASYEDRVQAYETKLDSYNKTVERYNAQGGAPSDVYASLKAQKQDLDTEQQSLNSLAAQLNGLVTQINAVGEQGNSIVKTYNQGVNIFNNTFGKPREFTQGDYQNGVINIYSFANKTELKDVLAHELGHALSLQHVEGTSSIMYYLIGGQPSELVPSSNDLAEFNRVCGSMTVLDRMKLSFEQQFSEVRMPSL